MTTSRKNYKPAKRCSECGANCTRLDENKLCYGCELAAKKKKGVIALDNAEHPAIMKRKRQR
jgi:hypothetical protein